MRRGNVGAALFAVKQSQAKGTSGFSFFNSEAKDKQSNLN
jgi:hypothetical protein